MANTYSGNVYRVDTTNTFAGPLNVVAIKYIGATSGTAVIEANGTDSGIKLWEESGDANVFNQVCLTDKRGLRIEVANGAVVYLYLK